MLSLSDLPREILLMIYKELHSDSRVTSLDRTQYHETLESGGQLTGPELWHDEASNLALRRTSKFFYNDEALRNPRWTISTLSLPHDPALFGNQFWPYPVTQQMMLNPPHTMEIAVWDFQDLSDLGRVITLVEHVHRTFKPRTVRLVSLSQLAHDKSHLHWKSPARGRTRSANWRRQIVSQLDQIAATVVRDHADWIKKLRAKRNHWQNAIRHMLSGFSKVIAVQEYLVYLHFPNGRKFVFKIDFRFGADGLTLRPGPKFEAARRLCQDAWRKDFQFGNGVTSIAG